MLMINIKLDACCIRREGKKLKVTVGEVKAQKGVIRTKIACMNKEWRVEFTGDFMVYPEEIVFQLEEELGGSPMTLDYYILKIQTILSKAELFGCTVDDFVASFQKAFSEASRVCLEY